MPAPTQPPYEAGALLQPRQLQRWLDVNKVSKLTRTETFWTMPAFSVATDWLGYSKIVAVFDFAATNNFSLPLDYDVPSNPNFCPCVMWVDEDYNVYRYKLWSDVGEVFFFTAPLYSGQLIKKNFRIEIWDAAPASYLTIILNAAGTLSVNQEYTYASSIRWDGFAGTPNINLASGVWTIENNLSQGYFSISEAVFPFGVWATEGFGSNPPPYASHAITLAMSSDLTIFTSVSGQYDYMWAVDTAMAEAETMVTNFSVSLNGNSAFDLPMQWPANSVPTTN
jgi:hypothetical protein